MPVPYSSDRATAEGLTIENTVVPPSEQQNAVDHGSKAQYHIECSRSYTKFAFLLVKHQSTKNVWGIELVAHNA
jgi:hypothetical protein